MPTIYRCEQGSEEWHKLHEGRITASKFATIYAGTPKGWQTLMENMRAGHFGGEHRVKSLDWGKRFERAARAAYELHRIGHRFAIEQVGFVVSDFHWRVGASPDALIKERRVYGTLEIKCPMNSENHVETLVNGMSSKHMAQVQGQMWVCDAEFCDFVSFDPRQEGARRIYLQRIGRDDIFIRRLEERMREFIDAFESNRSAERPIGDVPSLF